MNKCSLFLVGCLAISVFSISCSHDSVSVPTTESNKFENAGILHNEGLDYVLSELQNTQTKCGLLSKEDLEQTILSKANQFVSIHFPDIDQVIPTKAVTTYGYDLLHENQFESESAGLSYYQTMCDILNRYFVDDEDESFKSLDSLKLVVIADNMLNQIDKEKLLYGISVGIASKHYWLEKMDEWNKVFFPDIALTKGAPSSGARVRIHIVDEDGSSVM